MPEETFTIKEMLGTFRIQLDRIETKVDTITASKADRTEVERLAVRFEMLEKNGSVSAHTALTIAQGSKDRLDKLDELILKAVSDPESTAGGRKIANMEKRIGALEGYRIWIAGFGVGLSALGLGFLGQALGWIK